MPSLRDPREFASVHTWALRATISTLAWWAMVEGRPVGWYFGVIAIVGATTLSVALLSPGRWTVHGLLRFFPFFAVESLRGGVDVALRALRPGNNVRPAFVEVELSDRDPQLRLVVANIASLMPGTLATRLSEDTLVLHLLDAEDVGPRLPGLLAQVRRLTDEHPAPRPNDLEDEQA